MAHGFNYFKVLPGFGWVQGLGQVWLRVLGGWSKGWFGRWFGLREGRSHDSLGCAARAWAGRSLYSACMGLVQGCGLACEGPRRVSLGLVQWLSEGAAWFPCSCTVKAWRGGLGLGLLLANLWMVGCFEEVQRGPRWSGLSLVWAVKGWSWFRMGYGLVGLELLLAEGKQSKGRGFFLS